MKRLHKKVTKQDKVSANKSRKSVAKLIHADRKEKKNG